MRGKLLGFALALLSVATIGVVQQQAKAYVDTSPDCDKFSVIWCGSKTGSILRTEYDTLGTSNANGSTLKQADIPKIFTALGISRSDLNGDYQMGTVYQDGTVHVGSKVVAKSAVMAARYLGGTAIAGTTAAKVSVSKMASAQQALVKFDQYGRFRFAIMTPCSNPVIATPTQPAPVAACKSLSVSYLDEAHTKLSFKGQAEVNYGAQVQSYEFRVYDAKGNLVDTKSVVSTSTSASVTYTQTKPGNYTVKLVVHTNIGERKDSSHCVASFTVPVPKKPGIKIEKFVNGKKADQVAANQPFKYTVKVTNTGNVKLTDATVVDVPQEGITLVSAAEGTIANNHWTTKVTLNPGETKLFTLVAKVPTYRAGALVNNVCVDATEIPGTPDSCDHVTVKLPQVMIEKFVGPHQTKLYTTDVNAVYDYTIKVTNNGSVTLTNAVVADAPKAGVELVSAENGVIKNNIWVTKVTLQPGQSQTFVLKAKVPVYKAGNINNIVCVDATEIPGKPDDCDNAEVNVPTPPNMVQVCNPDTKEIITVDEKDADKYVPVDSAECKEQPTPTPKPKTPELPHTGPVDTIMQLTGLTSLSGAAAYYLNSRRREQN